MKEFAITSKKSVECSQDKYSGKKIFGKQIMHRHLLEFIFSLYSVYLDIYNKKHKVLWNINGINYISIPFVVLSQKSLDCAHGINQKAELKMKK